jgi:hypothetical protein
MSTFGKKATRHWNYFDNSKEAMLRWNHTPDEVKRQILEKWYPIGMEVLRNYSDGNKTGTIYVITEWSLYTMTHLGVKVISKEMMGIHPVYSTLNPMSVVPTEAELRNMKLQKLLNDN